MQIPNILKQNPQRFTTAIAILAVVAFIGLFNNFFLIWAFLGVLYVFSFHEALRLFRIENTSLYVYAIALWVATYFYPNPQELFFVVAIIVASVIAYKKDIDKKLFMPFLYPTVSFLFLLVLYNDFGIFALAWLLLIVALTDIGAYFVGKAIGKVPFSASSPNKTVEGVIGGIVIASVAGTLLGGFHTTILAAAIISFVVSLASVFGDLFESYLKREAGVKDSGKILPGHGGVLDRVDGYLFAGVIMVVLLRGAI
ncbi:MAG: phosphatidate cytidylyltransferase [Campylobacterota bacterium]